MTAKERPILFSGPMVQAILRELEKPGSGKSQTRRVVKPQPHELIADFMPIGEFFKPVWEGLRYDTPYAQSDQHRKDNKSLSCPYGKPGDRLWVREAWGQTSNINEYPNWPGRPHTKIEDAGWDSCVIYRADGHWQWCDDDGFHTDKSYWKPSIHMPRWASRILLEITDVRVERLQDISEADAKAEGIWHDPETDRYHYKKEDGAALVNPVSAFKTLWKSINGADSWEANPWVWAVSFRRIASHA